MLLSWWVGSKGQGLRFMVCYWFSSSSAELLLVYCLTLPHVYFPPASLSPLLPLALSFVHPGLPCPPPPYVPTRQRLWVVCCVGYMGHTGGVRLRCAVQVAHHNADKQACSLLVSRLCFLPCLIYESFLSGHCHVCARLQLKSLLCAEFSKYFTLFSLKSIVCQSYFSDVIWIFY